MDITHPNAFGLGIYDQDFEDFIVYSEKVLKDIEFNVLYRVDFIWSSTMKIGHEIIEIAGLKPLLGQNMDEALVVVENITVTKDMLQLMSRDKSPTLKIILPNGVSLIKFKSSEEEFNNLFSDSGCVVINIVGRCERNVYFNKISPQIIIEDYEIVSKQQYYF